MAKFHVDTDVMQSTIVTYQNAITDIEMAVSNAEKAIETLKSSAWQSAASKEYFNNFDASWKVNIEKRIQVITHLKECLNGAYIDYEDLCEVAAGLKNSI